MKIQPTFKSAYDLFHKGLLCFVDMEDEGICVDKNYYERTYEHLTKRIKFLAKEIGQFDEARLFKDRTNRDIMTFDTKLHVSHQDLSKLLFRFMEMRPIKLTEKENISSDDEVLTKIGSPFTQAVLKIKKLEKNRTTYIGGIRDLATQDEDGLWKIHPNFNLHIARSYRSSSDSPNFQNFPIHDEESMRLVRSGIIPRPGHKLGWTDFGGHEWRIMACYSRDPEMVKELRNGYDPHQPWADFLGTSRYDAKNSFTFALVYGSYYESIHADLFAKGYKNLPKKRVEEAEKEFWSKYRGLKQWQERAIQSYYQKGYLEMLTGFKVHGYLSRNQIVNTPIQGTAFHMLLWCCIRLNEIRKQEGWQTKLIGQIHDEAVKDIHPEEEEHVKKTIERVMVKETQQEFPWLIIPLLAEYSSGEVNQPWTVKKG